MSYVLAVTASIGNARMILRANVGETIQKSILVKNINNETINLELTASGDLEKNIKILDNNFTLAPGEEKNARFTIKITKNGAFESRINVKFFSPTEQKGVVLSSNIVVMVNQGDNNPDVNDTNLDVNDTNPDIPSVITTPTNPLMLLLLLTGAILLIFFIVLIVYAVKNGKNSNSIENNIKNGSQNNFVEKQEEKVEKVEKKTKPKKRTKRNE